MEPKRPLYFPVFFHGIIKPRKNRSQESITNCIFYGSFLDKKIKKQTASEYINGVRHISEKKADSLFALENGRLKQHIVRLGISDPQRMMIGFHRYLTNRLDITPSDRAKLDETYREAIKKSDPYIYFAEVLLLAVRFNGDDLKITEKEKAELIAIGTTKDVSDEYIRAEIARVTAEPDLDITSEVSAETAPKLTAPSPRHSANAKTAYFRYSFRIEPIHQAHITGFLTASMLVMCLAIMFHPAPNTSFNFDLSQETSYEGTYASQSDPEPVKYHEPATQPILTYGLHYADDDDAGTLWGDDSGGRPVYTRSEVWGGALGGEITLNSITDGEYGDERNFVGAALITEQETVWYGNNIEAIDGETYAVCLYVTNDNPDGLGSIAEGVRVAINYPTVVSDTQEVIGRLESTNATPTTYWDGVRFYADHPFYLEYIENSARFINGGVNASGLSDDVILGGVPLGYDRYDGKIPGGQKYSGIVVARFIVHSAATNLLTMDVRLAGTRSWKDEINANIGDTVEFQIKYKNMSPGQVDNVMIRDVLPPNMKYIPDSTVLYNSHFQNGAKIIENTVTTSGIYIGSYASRGNAYVRFSAQVVDEDLESDTYKLKNWASATVDGSVFKDDASVIIVKNSNFQT